MKNQQALAGAIKNLDEELNDLHRMASRIFPTYRRSPLGWLLSLLSAPLHF